MAFDPKTYGSNFLNIDRTVLISTRLQTAFADPGKYYTDRNAALAKMATTAKETFEKKFNELNALKFSEAESKRRAEDYTEAIMSVEMRQLNEDYPEDITKISAELTARKGGASKIVSLGSAAPKARRSRKNKK